MRNAAALQLLEARHRLLDGMGFQNIIIELIRIAWMAGAFCVMPVK
jgi:hypothetical protein